MCELRHGIDLPPAKKLSIHYFLLQSLLVEDALHTYTVPASWEIFINMSRDDNIRILAENTTPSSSEEGEHTEEG